jgi:hypothetical protein
MAALIPQEVTEHLEAAIQLSNRSVHLRFLDEAEALLSLDLPAAAVLVAGVVLEWIIASQGDQGIPEDRQRTENWSELRNGVAHCHGPTPSLDQAREMVEGIRKFLMLQSRVGPRLTSETSPAGAPQQVRGKYKFVPTTSAEFIRRKADELRLEHDERSN